MKRTRKPKSVAEEHTNIDSFIFETNITSQETPLETPSETSTVSTKPKKTPVPRKQKKEKEIVNLNNSIKTAELLLNEEINKEPPIQEPPIQAIHLDTIIQKEQPNQELETPIKSYPYKTKITNIYHLNDTMNIKLFLIKLLNI